MDKVSDTQKQLMKQYADSDGQVMITRDELYAFLIEMESTQKERDKWKAEWKRMHEYQFETEKKWIETERKLSELRIKSGSTIAILQNKLSEAIEQIEYMRDNIPTELWSYKEHDEWGNRADRVIEDCRQAPPPSVPTDKVFRTDTSPADIDFDESNLESEDRGE